MACEKDEGLVGMIVPKSKGMVLTGAQEMSVALWDCNMAHWVWMTLEEALFLNLKVSLVEIILGNEFVLWSNEEGTILTSNTAAAVGYVGALVRLNGFMLNNVHVVLQTNDWSITFQGCQNDVLIVVEEITTKNHWFGLYETW